MESKKKPSMFRRLVVLWLVLYDIVAVALAYFLALWLRFDCVYSKIEPQYLSAYMRFIPIYIAICIGVHVAMRLYRSVWSFVGFNELMRVSAATAITGVLHIIGITLLFKRMPISYYIIGIVLQFIFVLGIRFSYRFLRLLKGIRSGARGEEKNVMIIGAGSAGQMLLHDISQNETIHERVCCLIDDNENKWGRYIDGVKIVGGRNDILSAVEKYHIRKIYFVIAKASPAVARDFLNICKETDCELMRIPSMEQLYKGRVSVSAMREVNIEDLLGREQIRVDMTEIFNSIRGKVILVTGGGGSIGSELCRQIASHEPKQLIIFDIYENNAYEIQQELKKKYPQLDLVTLIGSVRDSRRLDFVFSRYSPEIVYHAAAHKHVPLMEDSPAEAIKNNVIGTYKTAYVAMAHGCRRFVLVSTDKAVNPTNVMGASKRLCEMVVQTFDRMIREGKADRLPIIFTHYLDSEMRAHPPQLPKDVFTEYVAVRFGNVLGSNGSVIPLFRKQIAAGGPVTVTHPDIIRYFMTIPEAVSLILQAGTYAHGGEIFVLDMGDPVKIDTLARNLIKLSGFRPDVDIKIEYVGLRPGEKLYEEKLMDEEGLRRTDNELIHVGSPIPFDEDVFIDQLVKLQRMAYNNDEEHLRDYLQEVVVTYHPAQQ